MRKHDDIESLFREKFDGYRIKPSEGLWNRVVRHLRRREFFHFSSGRFNIWYLVGLLTMGIMAYLALQERSSVEEPVTPPPVERVERDIDHPAVRSQESSALRTEEQEQPGGTATAGRGTGPVSTEETGRTRDIPEKEEHLPAEQPTLSLPVVDHPATTPEKAGTSQPVETKKDNRPPVVTTAQEKPAPVARFEVTPRKGCLPLAVDLINLSEYATHYSWSIEPGNIALDGTSPHHVFRKAGRYIVRLTVCDEEGRVSVSSDTVEVYAKPQARFDYTPKDAMVPEDQITFYNNSLSAERYLWSFGDGHTSTESDPVHKYTTDGPFDISLIVWSDKGCTDTLLLRDVFEHSEYYLRFPNAFMANPTGPSGGYYSEGSLANDVFHPVWKGVGDYHLQIFNRRGELVFESRELTRGWDGYILGQMATPGVYIWKARGTFLNGKPFVRFGNVTLIRKRH